MFVMSCHVMPDNISSSDLQDSCANSFAKRSMTSGDGTVDSWELKWYYPQARTQPNFVNHQNKRHFNRRLSAICWSQFITNESQKFQTFLPHNMPVRRNSTTAWPSIAKLHIKQLIVPHPAIVPFAPRAATNHVFAWQHCLMAHYNIY